MMDHQPITTTEIETAPVGLFDDLRYEVDQAARRYAQALLALDDLVAERDALQARIDAYEGRLEQWEKIDRLISESSLGTEEARAFQARTPPGVSHAIVRASQAMVRADAAEAERDRLRETLDTERAQWLKETRHAASRIGKGVRERDRLRAIVEAVRPWMTTLPVEVAERIAVIEPIEYVEAERDRLRAVVDAATVERDAYKAMPVIPHGEPHERWIQAHRALHAALDGSPAMGRTGSPGGGGDLAGPQPSVERGAGAANTGPPPGTPDTGGDE